MEQNGYLLLINHSLQDYLKSLRGAERSRVKEKLDYLANGLWDTGVRIKKLKSTSRKVIFEARLSRSRRLLFTLGTSDDRTAVYVWGIVEHGNIGREAARILPDNAPFLDFSPAEEESYPDISLDDLSEDYISQEAIEEKVAEDYGPQKWFVLDDQEWQRLLQSGGKEEIEPFLFLTREQNALLESSPPLLVSGTAGSGKTTLAVYYLLKKEFSDCRRLFLTYSPFLKRFSERIYRGLVRRAEGTSRATANRKSAQQRKHSPPEEEPEFLTFQELLAGVLGYGQALGRGTESAGGGSEDGMACAGLEVFEDIYSNHALAKKYDAELVWEEIRSIVKGAKPMISLGRLKVLTNGFTKRQLTQAGLAELKEYLLGVTNLELIDKIERIRERKTRFKSYVDFTNRLQGTADQAASDHEAAAFLLHHILKAAEKRNERLDSPLLTYQEYSRLGRKRAPNFLFDRQEIYAIAEYYQDRLVERGLKDEIDLCRDALAVLGEHEALEGYDLLVCDEVQDFADIQLALIFRLARPFHRVLLAGDTKQIINPSGFRWEEVKDKFYERGVKVPEIHNLSLNFRCVGSIVRMSNALLDLKQRLVGLSGAEIREEWKFSGKPPLVVCGLLEEQVLDCIRLTGAGRIVLTRDEKSQRKLKRKLKTELVFTIHEAKGLEFDTALLWKFGTDRKATEIWRRVASGYDLEHSHYPHIRHELNLLYVAITRARNALVIYDGPRVSDLWSLQELSGLFYQTQEAEAVSRIWERVSTPEEWKAQGEYFFEREYYPAAYECYRNAGDEVMTERAEAFALQSKGRFEKAAPLLEKHGYAAKAAECYEHCGRFEQAARLWQKVGKKKNARRCLAQLHERNGQYDEAARVWQLLREPERAFQNWQKAGNHTEMAQYYHSKRSHAQAAECFERAGLLTEAATSFKRAKAPDKAAELFLRGGDPASAAMLFRRLRNTKKLIDCYRKLGDHYAAGKLYEREKNLHKAVESYRSFVSASEENRRVLEAEAVGCASRRQLTRAAVRYSALSMFEESAPLYARARKHLLAVEDYRAAGNPAQAAECLASAGKHHEAAVEMEKLADQDKAEWVAEQLALFLYGGSRYLYYSHHYDRKRAETLLDEANSRMESGDYEEALTRYKMIRYPEGISQAYHKLDRDDDALVYLLSNDMVDYAEEYVDDHGEQLKISASGLARLTEAVLDEPFWAAGERWRGELMIRLLSAGLRRDFDAVRPTTERWLAGIPFYRWDVTKAPPGYLDLVLEARSYNRIIEIFRFADHVAREALEGLVAFSERVRQTAEREQDSKMLACCHYLEGAAEYERSLENLKPDRWCFRLFGYSRLRYADAVAFLMQQPPPIAKAIEEAATICRINDDYAAAGRVYEQDGNLGKAGRHYRDAGNYEDALRCYRTTGSRHDIARVYERMKRFDDALSIWQSLGRQNDIKRVQKKVAAVVVDETQLKLF